MGLRLIYGRAGSGKSTYCFSEISKKIKNKENCNIFIITPEQFSFTAEKKLMECIDNNAVINSEVLTFNRMAYRVISEVGGGIKTNFSKSAKSMLIYSILQKNSKKLKFLNKSIDNIELIQTILTELKKHNINIDDLKNVKENAEDNYLKIKLEDIIIIYEEFQNYIKDKYIDENDILTLLEEKIDDTDFLKNSYIYIDEFSGFTTQEYIIIKKLIKIAKQVSITITTDNLEKNNSPETDLFYSNKITVSKLKEIVNSIDEKDIWEEPVYLKDLHRFKNNEMIHIEKNIYNVTYEKYEKKLENIKMFLALNQYTEIEHVATEIIKLVRDEKYHYRDISIITKEIDTYSGIAKAVFSKYNIPIFIDEKKDLSQNILVKYLLSILEIYSKNWSYDAVFNYLKTGLVDIDNYDIYKMENYAVKWNIKGKKWLETWNYGLDKNNKEEIKGLEKLRKQIIDPLIELKAKLDGEKNVESISKYLYEFLIKNEIDRRLQRKIERLNNSGFIDIANEYTNSWNIIINLFDELVLVFKNDKITFEKYIDILKIGLKNTGLSKIPGTQDQVILGDVDRSRSHKVKAIFILGLNDGVFPGSNSNEGFFNDNDRNILKDQNIEMAKTTVEKLYEDSFNIYKAFTTTEEKLYLSYVSADLEGKSLRQSTLITKVKKIFPKIDVISDIIYKNKEIMNEDVTFDNLIYKLNKLKEGENIEDIWIDIYNYYERNSLWKNKLYNSLKGISYTNNPEKINDNVINKLYGDILKTSVSKLETYSSCPFSFYLKYGLKIRQKEEFNIKPIDTGSFMHEIIDEFFKIIQKEEIQIKNIEIDELEKIVNSIIEEKLNLNQYYILTSTPKFKTLTNRLKKVTLKSIIYIVQSLSNSDFEVLGNEIEFGENKRYNPIILDLEDGKKVEITGKIDRVDIAKTNNDKYIRIIDYKSSIKNLDLNEVFAGIKIQLLTYLDATCKIEDMLPAGVLYFNLIDPMVKSKSNMTNEQIEEEIRKKFKMQGLILADIEIVRKMDNSLDKGASKIIPAYIDKDGNISNTKSSIITKEQFGILQKYIQKTIKEISKEILNGNIELKPYYNLKSKKTPCEYCEYKPICKFGKVGCKNEYKYIGNIQKDLIFDLMNNK